MSKLINININSKTKRQITVNNFQKKKTFGVEIEKRSIQIIYVENINKRINN